MKMESERTRIKTKAKTRSKIVVPSNTNPTDRNIFNELSVQTCSVSVQETSPTIRTTDLRTDGLVLEDVCGLC